MSIRAIIIDAKNQRVVETSFPDSDIRHIYGAGKFSCVALAHMFPNRDTVYVDDEGLLKPVRYGFTLEGAHQDFFAGNGVLLGSDRQGETVDAKTPIEDVIRSVGFSRII